MSCKQLSGRGLHPSETQRSLRPDGWTTPAAVAQLESTALFTLSCSSSSSRPKEDPEVQGGVQRTELFLLGKTGEVPAGAESVLQGPVSRR